LPYYRTALQQYGRVRVVEVRFRHAMLCLYDTVLPKNELLRLPCFVNHVKKPSHLVLLRHAIPCTTVVHLETLLVDIISLFWRLIDAARQGHSFAGSSIFTFSKLAAWL
jgi:hypothetical protein